VIDLEASPRTPSLDPDAIAEVEIDAAYERETAIWRQPPRFLRLRTDISIFDVQLADPSP
jgi:hypothetical protein